MEVLHDGATDSAYFAALLEQRKRLPLSIMSARDFRKLTVPLICDSDGFLWYQDMPIAWNQKLPEARGNAGTGFLRHVA
ncbi:MAG: hypothetical protein HQL44_09930 [Alphaproteobacteria bacterium]|nr:hypothetical protein [Alphaproteobacteria bacterium]